ncbi:MAG TPA: DNA polymerase III subunit epsilon [Oxalobacteraceae bacterium]|nr:DNA polymerase III subunit epsilon [Oxalobacteraceae bacterium]
MGQRDVVIITGSSGNLGTATIHRLAKQYQIAGFDEPGPPYPVRPAYCIPVDTESRESIETGLNSVREHFGNRIASIIHLAGYYSFTGEPSPKYYTVNILGTRHLLDALKAFEVEQFIFASTILVYQPTAPDQPINEEWPLNPKWDYPKSKVEAEAIIVSRHCKIPYVNLRLAGVYDEDCRAPSIANQVQLIYERQLISHVFPGDITHGQAFMHRDDLVEAFALVVERRKQLPAELTINIGEPDTVSYDAMQRELGRLIHGEDWETRQIPKALAKTGAWLEEVALPKDKEPFIKPWMIDLADDHYELDISRARDLLGWQPRHRLIDTLPEMVRRLKQDPVTWYKKNKLHLPDALQKQAEQTFGKQQSTNDKHSAGTECVCLPPPGGAPAIALSQEHAQMQQHGAMPMDKGAHDEQQMLIDEHLSTLWPHFVNLIFGLWLITGPFAMGYLSAHTPDPGVMRVMAERGLPSAEVRNLMMTWSDVISGALIVTFSLLSISPKRRFPWAQWANAVVGFWLLMAPLVFWAPLPAAYNNDTIVGALVIAFSVLVPMMPGMSMAGMMGAPDIPPGWNYCPSTWLQRLPIAAMGVIGFLISRYLTAYQLGHIDQAWDPFFGQGTMTIITSDMSKAWPIADAGLGGVAYMLEILMAAMGNKQRWRTMPWMVLAFGILVVPLGGVSIFFIIIQPIAIGPWCTLCLVAALAMVIMIPYALDELVAMGQFLLDAKRKGKPLWRVFWMGDAMEGGSEDKAKEFRGNYRDMFAEMVDGTTLPWTLLLSTLLGVWLMLTRLSFDTSDAMANSDHLVGALVVTFSIMAMAEVGRPVRFINVGFGLWLIGAPWLLEGVSANGAVWNSMVTGIVLIALALPRGTIRNAYASWDRILV